MKTIRLCPGCGGPLAPDAPAGLCPACLLKSDRPTLTIGGIGDGDATRSRIVPGQNFGAYRIIRRLGQGGMGEVFEAEDVETGRRVALKVLSYAPESPTARQRFLREGRLAASVNHPNCVYVYGAEEIEGAPVITMEYVSGGTLQDRVKRQGRMPVREAVDAILQVIAGLEAAGEKGVLHRDVKPSNCFVEADGTVKVGDFGLSISTLARDQTALTMAGSIMGTPAYASPEQLRGDELDTRSDIYSVGVTLYYLLTSQTPFHGENLAGLIATVLEKPAPPPGALRKEIPEGLEEIVLRCLAKRPEKRFKDYGQLREALLPFGSTAPTMATLGMRVVAGIIDAVLLYLVGFVVAVAFSSPAARNHLIYLVPALGVPYFAVLEGFWGFSLGKWICRLRVVGPNRNFPGFPRALNRAILLLAIPSLPLLLPYYDFLPEILRRGVFFVAYKFFGHSFSRIVFAVFLTARRRNGFACVHELLSKTRVIELAAYESRPKLTTTGESTPHTGDAPAIGPFHVLNSLARQDQGEILLGFDPRLLRKAWIHKQPPGTAPIPAQQRNLSRKGRLHWLAGRRSEMECWDAYEALTGQPLADLLQAPQPWQSIRFWLYDLAQELEAARLDGSWPDALGMERVWITADGRAKLLDFPPPGASAAVPRASQGPEAETANAPSATLARNLLDQVAHAALSGRALPPEIHTDAPHIPLPVSARGFLKRLPSAPDLHSVLDQLRPLLDRPATVSRARRLALLSSCALFLFLLVFSFWPGPEDPAASPEKLPSPFRILFWIAFGSLLVGLLIRRGPLLRTLGIEIITRNGSPAGRRPIFVRSAVTWLPLLLLGDFAPYGILWQLPLLVIFLGGAAFALIHPERGIQDRMAGTWLVPE